MGRLNPFRLSFDGPLHSRERMRARVSATVVGGAALFLGVTSLLAVLNASSEAIENWSNSKPEPEVRIVAADGEGQSGKACEDQTWPYIEARCLKRVDAEATVRSTPKHGLASEQVALPAGPAAVTPPLNSRTTVQEPETTGTATPPDISDEPRTVGVPLPAPAARSDASLSSDAAVRARKDGAAQQSLEASPPRLSPREQRRVQREQRVRLQQERRIEARRARAERQRARSEARNDARRNRQERRIVRSWTEYTYASPSGRSERVIVIRRGSLDDDFFRTIR